MYDEAVSMLAEPAEIKAQLPISYVAEKAGLHLIHNEGGKLSALCPFHNDRTPSFDIYRWGEGQRWGCWVCGVGGDVFDFIMRAWPVEYGRFRPAVDAAKRALAQMNAEGWTAPTLRDPLDFDPEAALNILNSAHDYSSVEQLIAVKRWRLEPDWLAGRWGVRGLGGEVLVPYVDVNGALRQLKHRPANGARPLLSLPGSGGLKGILYGEQHYNDTTIRNGGLAVLLCEGESDTWHGDRHLPDYTVLGIPAGAGAVPTRLDLLAGRQVVCAFDNDDAGNLGAERWRVAVESVGGSWARMELPEGSDLTSALTG